MHADNITKFVVYSLEYSMHIMNIHSRLLKYFAYSNEEQKAAKQLLQQSRIECGCQICAENGADAAEKCCRQYSAPFNLFVFDVKQ